MEISKLQALADLAELLETQGNIVEANAVHNLFLKQASEFKKDYEVPFPMNLDDALNNYDSNTYEVDKDGQWEDTVTINDFREETSDDMMHSPATVDDNHLVFYNEDEDKVRKEMVSHLGLKRNFRVLELSCGTGRDSLNIANQLDQSGELYVQDLSGAMLAQCKLKLANVSVPVEYSLQN